MRYETTHMDSPLKVTSTKVELENPHMFSHSTLFTSSTRWMMDPEVAPTNPFRLRGVADRSILTTLNFTVYLGN